MKEQVFLGIDTSNYTTSFAAADMDGNIIANLKKPLAVAQGGCGLRQSDAVFAHIKNIPELSGIIGELLCGRAVAAVGVSAKPRRAEGSYMPCFLSGEAAASAAAAACGARLYRFSHQEGHIMAALYGSGHCELADGKTFAAYHISGGTTDLMTAAADTDGFEIQRIGGTLDLNMGQAIDRVGVFLGFSFPAGREMEAAALAYGDGPRTKARVSVSGVSCNLSGLQNLAENEMNKYGSAGRTAAFVFDFCLATIEKMTDALTERCGGMPILFAGGVTGNSIIRASLEKKYGAFFAPPEYSSDNACGAALLARRAYINREI